MEEKFEDIIKRKSILDKEYKYEIFNKERIDHYKKDNVEACKPAESDILIKQNNQNLKNENDIISLSTIIIYSLPSFGKMSCLVIININGLLFYESIGASLIFLSFFVALARSVEIILKPLIAHLSDSIVSKYGRRKPFMLIGCFFYAIFLVLLFSPPGMRAGVSIISIWFGIFYVLFFISETIVNVPYLALGPELSKDSKQRERLYIYFYLFQYFGVLFASAAPVILNSFKPACDCSYCVNNPIVINIVGCVRQCEIFCNLKNNQTSLYYISIFIGLFCIISITILCWKIKEKNNTNENENSFIPSLYQLIENKPFVNLITPWIIDIMITTVFATMLPFFLNYVINPQKYCRENNINLNSDQCNVNVWLGYAISIFFIFCMLFMFVWHYFVKQFGKIICWQIYSLISILTFSLFLMCKEGSLGTLLFASVFCSIPAGGAYLNEVFVSDIIDYDEFLTRKRNEGLYTVFAAFIPKIVSIFAQSIPLTLMSFLGFVPSDNGRTMEQPSLVILFIKFVIRFYNFFSFLLVYHV